MKLESGVTVYRADFITSRKTLGRWIKGDVPSHAAGGVPASMGDQAAAEQGKAWVMLLVVQTPGAETAASASAGTAVPILQPYLPASPCSSCSSGSLSSFVSSFGYSPPAISPYLCHLWFFFLMVLSPELLPYK